MSKEKETLNIILNNGQEVIVEYDGSVFDEVVDELHKAMKFGSLYSLDASYDVSMYLGENYISALNGKLIAGYSL